AFHRERKAALTIGPKAVDNPLEFGIVVTDEEGRVERFLEKPSWGQVFSDTINTGIYVLEPEVMTHVPDDRPYDFSKELFPYLLEMGRPIYGFAMDGYWQDIGNLDQYRQANVDALEERVRLHIPGIRLRGNIWLGEGVERVAAPVRPRRSRRPGERRPHTGDGGAHRRGTRDSTPARRPCRRQSRVGAGLPDDQASDDLGLHVDRDRRRRPACDPGVGL